MDPSSLERNAEIERRQAVLNESTGNTGNTGSNAPPTMPRRYVDMYDENQKFVLFNIAHIEQRPINSRPSFRVIGFFPSEAKAIAKASSMPGDCSIFMAPVGAHNLLCSSLTNQNDPNYVSSKISTILKMNEDIAASHTGDFKKRTSEPNVAGGSSTTSQPSSHSYKSVDPPSGCKEVSDFMQSNAVRNQTFSVCSSQRDLTVQLNDPPEPIVIFWRSFQTEADATDYVTNTLSKDVTNLNIDVVDMYEWIFPEDVDRDKLNEGYRNKELNTIMAKRKTAKDDIKDYERQCEVAGVAPRQTIVQVDTTSGITTVDAPGPLASVAAFMKSTDGTDVRIADDNIKVDGTIMKHAD